VRQNALCPANHLNTRRLQKVWFAGSTCDADDRYTASGSYTMLPKFTEDVVDLCCRVDTGAYQILWVIIIVCYQSRARGLPERRS